MKKMILLVMLTLALCLGTGLAEEGLPAYVYPGSDPVEAAVAAWMTQGEIAQWYAQEAGSALIPAPVIVKESVLDAEHIQVYGNFWHFSYVRKGDVLEMISGGEAPGVLTLEKAGDGWAVAAAELAGDGENYAKDILRFCQGDKELEEMYWRACDGSGELLENARRRFIRAYVRANGLQVTAYQDPYWDPIPLEEQAGAGMRGEITEGSYVLHVPLQPGDPGRWQPDEMAQDDCVLRLAEAKEENGELVIRYEPTGDGDMAVHLRHVVGFVCDRVFSYDVRVRDGQVQEVTGGSYTASPDEKDLDPYLSGEWREKDTQFTQMTIAHQAEGGWDVEMVSPMTHGAFMARMRVYYDCEADALMYEDGTIWNLPITDSDQPGPLPEPALTGVSGRLAILPGENGGIELGWYSSHTPDQEEIIFTRME